MNLLNRVNTTPKAQLRQETEKQSDAIKVKFEEKPPADLVKKRLDLENKINKRIVEMNNTIPTNFSLLLKDYSQLFPLNGLSKSEQFNAKWRFIICVIFILAHSYQFHRNIRLGVPYIPLSRADFVSSGLFITIGVCSLLVIGTLLASKYFKSRYTRELAQIQAELDTMPLVVEKSKADKKKEMDNITIINDTPLYDLPNRTPLRQATNRMSGGHLGARLFE